LNYKKQQRASDQNPSAASQEISTREIHDVTDYLRAEYPNRQPPGPESAPEPPNDDNEHNGAEDQE
jgi:hypothetical protein